MQEIKFPDLRKTHFLFHLYTYICRIVKCLDRWGSLGIPQMGGESSVQVIDGIAATGASHKADAEERQEADLQRQGTPGPPTATPPFTRLGVTLRVVRGGERFTCSAILNAGNNLRLVICFV